jgi:hypothetical protein
MHAMLNARRLAQLLWAAWLLAWGAGARAEEPAWLVLPGSIKSVDAEFQKQCNPQAIAALAEAELGSAHVKLVPREALGEGAEAYIRALNLGDVEGAARALARGGVPGFQRVIRLDVMGTHRDSQLLRWVSSGVTYIAPAGPPPQGVQATVAWRFAMRYQVLDARSTEMLAQGEVVVRQTVRRQTKSTDARVQVPMQDDDVQQALVALVREAIADMRARQKLAADKEAASEP